MVYRQFENRIGIKVLETLESEIVIWFPRDRQPEIEYPDPTDNGETTTWNYLDEDIGMYDHLIAELTKRREYLCSRD